VSGRLRWFAAGPRLYVSKFGIWMVRIVAEPDDFGVDRWHIDLSCEGMRLPMSFIGVDLAKQLAENAARVLVEQAAHALGMRVER
jgi:hypothetical protein